MSRPEETQRRRGAVRLTFGYDGDRVRLVERLPLDRVAPGGDPGPPPKDAAGFRVELRDSRGRPVYWRTLHNPIRLEHEVFSERPGDPITHVPADDPRGTFFLVVPDLPEAKDVVLHG